MKREIAVGACAAALAVVGLVGCSSSGSKPAPASTTAASSSAAAGPTATKVVVDGQDQNVAGAATCTAAGDNVNIGVGDPSDGVGAVVTNTDPPAVHAVGLGSPNGSTLGFSDAAAGQGNAVADKFGNSYRITGTAVGLDPTNSQPVTKPFELDIVCP